MKNLILKYKTYLIISLIAILILISTDIFSKKTVVTTPSPQPTSQTNKFQQIVLPTPVPITTTPPQYSQPPLNSYGKVDLSSTAVKTAISNKSKIAGSLPIYVKDFKTSNGLLTTLNVYSIPEDPNYLIHIEIYGIDFEDQNISKAENPNVTAFIESFNEIKRQLTNKGVDIHNIYFVFGGQTYIQITANLWIKTFNLL